MAFETNRAEGIDPSAGRSVLDAPDAAHGSRAYAASFALLGGAFALYGGVVLTSVLGLSPLGSRAAALTLLTLALAVACAVLIGQHAGRQRALPPVPRDRRPGRGPASDRARRAVGRVALAVAGSGALVACAGFGLALALPVGAYDALGYRLPAVVQWLDAGALVWVAGDDPLRNGYPLGLEVIEAVSFRALAAPDAVDACAYLFLLAGAGSLAGYARTLGLTRPLAALTAALFLLVPIHILNAPSGYADAAFAGAVVALFIALARWVEVARRSPWLLCELGVSAGWVIALKPHGFAFAAVALGLGLWLRGRRAGLGRASREGAAACALAAPGLFFAARNLVQIGNPIYPLELRIGSRVLLPGPSSLASILTPDANVPSELAALPSFLRPLWVWLQPHGPARSFDDRLAGLGYAFVLLGLPALLWLMGRAYRSRVQQPGLGALLSATWLCWLLQPLSFWSRFTSWLWGAAALAIALGLHALLESGRGRSALVLSCSIFLLTLPEALYALHHVKRLERFGLTLLRDDSLTALTRVAGVDRSFVERELVGKRDVCRSAWRLGTDDANLDGVVAQLSPRPRMHVFQDAPVSGLLAEARAHGCDQLMIIGNPNWFRRLPPGLRQRAVSATAFGSLSLLPVLSAEVIP
ncbi:MAG: hypothetical protein JWN48_3263 [Myxococcaceae bacterium]|nr:hypothetical protein [Myxococcaceae bacterium]